MYYIILIHVNRKDERRSGKGNPKTKIDLEVFYDVTHELSLSPKAYPNFSDTSMLIAYPCCKLFHIIFYPTKKYIYRMSRKNVWFVEINSFN